MLDFFTQMEQMLAHIFEYFSLLAVDIPLGLHHLPDVSGQGVLAPCIKLTMKNSLSSLHFDSWGYSSYVNGQTSTQKEGPQHRVLRSVPRYNQMIHTHDDNHDGQSMDPFESL